MRTIPFKIIAILGLNDGDFPKLDMPPSFDLISKSGEYEPGDRSNRIDDRYQFLDTLLSTRQALYLSYLGQSAKTNKTMPPSVVISELQQTIKLEPVQHPMQAFSQRYFTDKQLCTYSTESAAISKQLLTTKKINQVWQPTGRSPVVDKHEQKEILIGDLQSFYRDPQKFFVNRVLGIFLTNLVEERDSSEPFALEGLDEWEVTNSLVDKLIDGIDSEALKNQLLSSGAFLSGTIGKHKAGALVDEITLFADRIKQLNLGAKLQPLIIDQQVGKQLIIGELGDQYENDNCIYSYSSVKLKHKLNALLNCLLSNKNTHLLGFNKKEQELLHYHFSTESEKQNINVLAQLLEIYNHGQSVVSDLWISAASEYIENRANGKDKDKSLIESIKVLKRDMGEGYNGYTPSPEHLLVSRGLEIRELLNEQFIEQSEQLKDILGIYCTKVEEPEEYSHV